MKVSEELELGKKKEKKKLRAEAQHRLVNQEVVREADFGFPLKKNLPLPHSLPLSPSVDVTRKVSKRSKLSLVPYLTTAAETMSLWTLCLPHMDENKTANSEGHPELPLFLDTFFPVVAAFPMLL